MSASIDLNIDNYTMNDLIRFFKLNTIYTFDDLSEGEKHMSSQIISSDYKTNYKHELLQFIKKAKNILTAKLGPIETKESKTTNNNSNTNKSNNTNKTKQNQNENSYDNIINGANTLEDTNINTDKDTNIGKIINPGAPHPALQTQHIPKFRTNAYNSDTRVSNYVLNTLFRDNFEGSWATDCTFTLPKKLTNIISLTLSGLQYPNYGFAFANGKDTTTIYIYEETTDIEGTVIIPEGNYTVAQFPAILEQAINVTLGYSYDPVVSTNNRFQVYINPYTNFTTILNTVNNFRINTTKGQFQKCPMVPNFYTPNVKTGISRETLIKTLGYQIGFRETEYIGAKSYTSESLFKSTYADYVYFVLNDYCNNQSSNNYSLFQNQIFDNNVLAIIPVTSAAFTSTFADNSNFIYKTRNYHGPVNITKISIQLTDQFGFPINIYYSDFIFCLQTVDIYNNVIEYTSNNVTVI